MKVYQLMTILEKAPTGAEVVLNMTATLNASVEHASADGDEFILTDGDAEVMDWNGESIVWLSEI